MLNAEFRAVASRLNSKNSSSLSIPRAGIMLHYDDGASDAGGLAWFGHPKCEVSYNRYYFDNGETHSVADDDRVAWHAGKCLTPNANSVFYGLAAATNSANKATRACVESIVDDCARIYRYEMKRQGWTLDQIPRRIVGHDEQAIFTREKYPNRRDLWGKLGRRSDPHGQKGTAAYPVMGVAAVEIAVALILKGRSAYTPDTIAPTPQRRPLDEESLWDAFRRRLGIR